MANDSYLFFLESLDQIDRAIRQSEDLDQMMKDVLDAVLSIFDSDRAWLLYPCDPGAPSWGVPMERTRIGYPGALIDGKDIPMLPEAREVFQAALESNKPVAYDANTKRPLPDQASEQFNIRSQITVAIYPKLGRPWLLGMHQCSHPHVWNDEEQNLFHEIGRRIADALNTLLLIKELRESEEKYRTILEALKETVYICSPEFEIEYMNPAMIKKIGRDATGEICYQVLYNRDEKCSWCIFDQILKGKSIEYELSNPVDNRFYSINNFPISRSDGSVSKLTLARDISELKAMRDQLHQTQKMESIGNLAGGIAHDFNNILFPIIGMSELLLQDLPRDSQGFEFVQEILRAGKRGSDLVKQILAFSRQSEHKLIPVSVQQVIKEILRLTRATIPSYIEIQDDIPSDCGLIMADPTQLHQVAMNIITNAYHAVESEGGKISVELKEVEQNSDELPGSLLESGRYAVLSISDNGHGMSTDLMEKIYEPYFTTKEEGKGTGLGLAVAYGIIKKHKGDIRVYSEVGKGTTFTIYLPLMEKPADTEPIDEIKDSFSGNERILLVDDEEPIAMLQKQLLERLGYKVAARISSLEAINAFKANPDGYDLIITDMSMPNMTGEQLAKEMMAIRPDIPIIICTGFSERINKEKAEAIGIRGFLMKPVLRSEMARVIRNVLDESKGSEQQ